MSELITATTLHDGRFVLKEILGRGGMATVYRAFDALTEREVALKILHAHLREHPLVVSRFRQEVGWVQGLEHPHIVRIHSLIDTPEALGLVMDLHGTGDLKVHLQRGGPMGWEAARAIVVQVLAALEAAHAQGIVHQDIKPHNILLDDDGVAKLIDFGLAELDEAIALSRPETAMGTVEYSAPEQFDDFAVDARADLYSLAVTLFEMLSASLPYRGETAASVIRMHREAPVPDVRVLVRRVPQNIADVISRAMAKDPQDRFESAAQMRRALLGDTHGAQLRPERLALWDDLKDQHRPDVEVDDDYNWHLYLPRDVNLFDNAKKLAIQRQYNLPSELGPSQREAIQAVLRGHSAHLRVSQLELEDQNSTLNKNLHYEYRHFVIALACGMNQETAEAMRVELGKAGVLARCFKAALTSGKRRGGWQTESTQLWILALLTFGGVVSLLFGFARAPASIATWLVMICAALLTGFALNAFAMLSVYNTWRRLSDPNSYLLAFERTVANLVQDPDLKAHHVEVYHHLRSSRVRETYERIVLTLLAMRQLGAAHDDFDGWAARDLGGLFDQAAAIARRIAELEAQQDGQGHVALFEQLARLDAQITRLEDGQLIQSLIEQKVALSSELARHDARQRELTTLGNRLLRMASELHAAWLEARGAPQSRVVLPNFALLDEPATEAVASIAYSVA
ncbi:MAG: serine/threonine protein kinase [Bradymonadaceae bacterium]|nr:serine/threonine protein kinase [Lujinxingiaceae bacterium]